jgi:hypothetical protein
MRGRKGRHAGLILGMTLLLGACGHHRQLDADNSSDDELNAYPSNYKADILAAMHSYLNDPTGIRDAAISQPVLKSSGSVTRYMVCVQFNPKKNASEYAGIKEAAAVFLVGRFDHFVDTLRDECAGVTYAPFPELQKLSP